MFATVGLLEKQRRVVEPDGGGSGEIGEGEMGRGSEGVGGGRGEKRVGMEIRMGRIGSGCEIPENGEGPIMELWVKD